MKRLQAKQSSTEKLYNWLTNERIGQLIFVFLLIVTTSLLHSGNALAVKVDESKAHIPVTIDIEIPVQSYTSSKSDKNDYILLWIPSEAGILEQEKVIARELATSGVEVWLADLHAGLIVGTGRSSIDKFKQEMLANLVDAILEKSGKKIYLFSNSRGVIAALRAAHGWRKKFPKKYKDPAQAKIAGAILLSGQFYSRTPEPGFDGVFNPLVDQSRLRIMLLQPNKSPWFWKLPAAKKAFEKAGSTVSTWILKGVRDRFYYRHDATEAENKKSKHLAKTIFTTVSMLESDDAPVNGATNNNTASPDKTTATPVKAYKNKGLSPWRGTSDTPPLNLTNLDEKLVNISSYKGKVVLVNFWASWCPPCVHEMPSMQKLEDQFKSKGFNIVAVNMAEKRSVIKKFISDIVKVNFQILLDSNGAALKKWKVYAFPTSYLLGKKGKIRYAVYGAIDWNSANVHKTITTLLAE